MWSSSDAKVPNICPSTLFPLIFPFSIPTSLSQMSPFLWLFPLWIPENSSSLPLLSGHDPVNHCPIEYVLPRTPHSSREAVCTKEQNLSTHSCFLANVFPSVQLKAALGLKLLWLHWWAVLKSIPSVIFNLMLKLLSHQLYKSLIIWTKSLVLSFIFVEIG